MKNIRQQKNPYGCGFYALANLLDLDTFEKLGEDQNLCLGGNDSYQLNLFLMEYGVAILPLYQNLIFSINGEFGLIATEDKYLPFLMSIMLKSGRNHMVSGKMMSDGRLEIYDSLKEDVISVASMKEYISLSEINAFFGLYEIIGESGNLAKQPIMLNEEVCPSDIIFLKNRTERVNPSEHLPEFFKTHF